MDTALDYHGDFLKDENGKGFLIDDEAELWQKVYLILSAKKGQFVYDRTLGSEIGENPQDTRKVEASARAALKILPFAEVQKVELNADGVVVTVSMNGKTKDMKVRI